MTFVTFLWNNGFRTYLPEHVNILHNALRHWCKWPFRFVCITDEEGDFAPGVELMPLPASARRFTRLHAPQGDRYPSCYRRLWLLSDEAQVLGERVMQLDIDIAVLKDMAPFFEVEGDFVGYCPDGRWGRWPMMNGSMWLVRPGKTRVWRDFLRSPDALIRDAKQAGYNGSDQAVLSYCFCGRAPTWDNQRLGVYGPEEMQKWPMPPKNARIVMFNGQVKPWESRRLWARAYCNHFRRAHAAQERPKPEGHLIERPQAAV